MGLAKAIYSKSQLRGQFDNHGNFIYPSSFFSILRLLKTWNPLEFPSSKQVIQVIICVFLQTKRKRQCYNDYSVASTTPNSEIPKEASASGKQGESTTLQIRVVPLPFFRRNLVVNVHCCFYLVVLA